jgi:hypothetical protein
MISCLFHNLCSLVATLHQSPVSHSYNETRISPCSQLPRWLNLTWASWADFSHWMLTANSLTDLPMSLVWLCLWTDWLLYWVPTLTDWQLTLAHSLLAECQNLPSCVELRGLVREHLVQGFSVCSLQREFVFILCCLGSICLSIHCHWNMHSYCGHCVAIDVI